MCFLSWGDLRPANIYDLEDDLEGLVAVPVGAPKVLAELDKKVDELLALESPSDIRAVGASYESFFQTSDAEVIELLEEAAGRDE